MTGLGNLESARVALAAASAAPEPDVAALYLAVARTGVEKAKADLRELEAVLNARELALVARVGPRQRELPITHEGD